MFVTNTSRQMCPQMPKKVGKDILLIDHVTYYGEHCIPLENKTKRSRS